MVWLTHTNTHTHTRNVHKCMRACVRASVSMCTAKPETADKWRNGQEPGVRRNSCVWHLQKRDRQRTKFRADSKLILCFCFIFFLVFSLSISFSLLLFQVFVVQMEYELIVSQRCRLILAHNQNRLFGSFLWLTAYRIVLSQLLPFSFHFFLFFTRFFLRMFFVLFFFFPAQHIFYFYCHTKIKNSSQDQFQICTLLISFPIWSSASKSIGLITTKNWSSFCLAWQ